MKIFISADIEGITTTTSWDECNDEKAAYGLHAKQMTAEVLACIEGAFEAGATEIYVKDAHSTGRNIDPTMMPEGVKLIRAFNGHPYSMVFGIDSTFDAAMFVGYHGGASSSGNPLAHTFSGKCSSITMNDMMVSEFVQFSYAAALEGVPTVFLSGDKSLCEESKDLHPGLIAYPVKDGVGQTTINYSVKETLKGIKENAKKALSQDLKAATIKLPENFKLKLTYKNHNDAEHAAWYPGMTKESAYVVSFECSDYFEVLRTLQWVL